MFVDKAHIHVKAGNGGNGIVSFRREKYVPDGGPDGGDGGRGGSIVLQVDTGMRTLMDFRYKRKYVADNGKHGSKKNATGRDADDLVLLVPPGTIVIDEESNRVIADLVDGDSRAVICKGGRGGRGNTHFKNPVRQAPTFAEQGFYGEERNVVLELKMLADVGLVGYPNVGKSTLLSQVTKAKPKIANYHFTTLTPNLGVVEAIKGKSFVMADIPGLIDGAHEGVGLGHDFLRHVERTKLILHVVDVSGIEGRDPVEDFERINSELEKYSPQLATRKQIVIANKSDLLFEEGKLEEFQKAMEEKGLKVFVISAATSQGIAEVMEYVTTELDNIEDIDLYEDIMDLEEEVVETKGPDIDYKIEKGKYIVFGRTIERLVYSTDFENVESLRRFQTVLGQRGVFDKLREMGIEDGDTVSIEGFEFDYYE
jgi:GTP-binding protein